MSSPIAGATMPDPSAGWAAPGSARSLTMRDFRLFQALIQREAGIHLSDAKRVLVEGRLARRLRELGLGFAAYYSLVAADEQERVRMLDCISTNETHFFREPRQFDFLQDHVFPEWQAQADAGRRTRRIRVWSAGCSTGEEPYSVAMAFLDRFPAASGWEIDILATDISTRVLDRARAAVWPVEKAKEIPPALLKAFMLRGTGPEEGRMKAGREIRARVRFERLNLNAEPFALRERFDLVFCRNVLIYFDAPCKARVLDRLLDRLDEQGYLFLGHAETVTGLTARTVGAGPTVYAHAGRPSLNMAASSRATASGGRA
jgi:chemotaxis protein methyltransferase CheR